jgi:hypothetical protein
MYKQRVGFAQKEFDSPWRAKVLDLAEKSRYDPQDNFGGNSSVG